MKVLSTAQLAKTVLELRKEKRLTQEKLGELTSLNRVMVGKIEREEFVPSVVQLQALAKVLGFEITDMFVEQEHQHSFIALHSESMSKEVQEGLDTLLSMMLALRRQMVLRRTYEEKC